VKFKKPPDVTMLQDIGGGNLRVGGRLVLTVHAHVASFGRHFFPTKTRPEDSNLQSQRAQRLEAATIRDLAGRRWSVCCSLSYIWTSSGISQAPFSFWIESRHLHALVVEDPASIRSSKSVF
jgi:hypothetical protein